MFSFFKKKEPAQKSVQAEKKETVKKDVQKVVWRDRNGKMFCPGDDCPKDCDDTCPIYLNTQALILMQMGHGAQAIPIYERAISIAPDFYDGWNNLAAIYGDQRNFQKAYDCYLKARELNKTKPNPVWGLMQASKDLGRYEEYLKWSEEYKRLTYDIQEGTERAGGISKESHEKLMTIYEEEF